MEDTNNISVVLDSEEKFIFKDGQILLQNNSENILFYGNPEDYNIQFELDQSRDLSALESEMQTQHQKILRIPNSETSETESSESIRCMWSQNSILKLINLFKKYEKKFKNTTIRNDKVWQIISNELGNYTPLQCKNRFKYLKQKYMEKKDNMSTKQTGAKAISFAYYEEFEEIFGKKDNAVPLAVASTSTQHEEKENGPVKKRKKSALEKHLTKYEEGVKVREKARADRHSQILERQDRALEILEKLAKLYEKKSGE